MIEIFLSFSNEYDLQHERFPEMGRLFNPGITTLLHVVSYVDLSLAVGKYIIGFEKHKTPGMHNPLMRKKVLL